jgi:glycosyltransferase involved in cell wall biosynthesis
MNEDAFGDVKGPVVIACAAPYGVGGLGRHFQEIVDFFKARAIQAWPLSTEAIPKWMKWAQRLTPLRFSVAWQGFTESIAFDRSVAKRLPRAETFIGFAGQSLRSIETARRLDYKNNFLATAIPHISLSVAQVRKAWEYLPIESTGYIAKQHERFLHEYEAADKIIYSSELVRESFLRENFATDKLERFDLSADARFKASVHPKNDSRFRVVAIGGISMIKGIAVLLDAFRDFKVTNAELTLIGGSGTSQMRKYLEGCLAQDQRVRIAPGDPLPHLQWADACVHPSFLDGFGYGPLEAMACGVPVIVTNTTGMKERVREGVDGFIIPPGDAGAITKALEKIHQPSPRA